MGVTEILVIIGCSLIVLGVITSAVIKKIKGIPSCGCCDGNCAHCKKSMNKDN